MNTIDDSQGGTAPEATLTTPPAAEPEQSDARRQLYSYGEGGVPFVLLLLYLSFLVFFTWYTLAYQVPDYFERSDGGAWAAADDDPAEMRRHTQDG